MVHFHEVAGQIAGVIFLSAFVLYFVQTIRGQMSPNRMTWLIWTLLGVLILASYKSVGAENTIWLAVAGAIGPFAILILTIWFGERGTSKLDIACLAGACVGLIGWWLTTNAFVGLVLFIAADCMGFIPTAVKIWRDPKSESLPAWTLWFLGSTFQFMALSDWSIRFSLYPIYFFVGQLTVILLALRRYQSRVA